MSPLENFSLLRHGIMNLFYMKPLNNIMWVITSVGALFGYWNLRSSSNILIVMRMCAGSFLGKGMGMGGEGDEERWERLCGKG